MESVFCLLLVLLSLSNRTILPIIRVVHVCVLCTHGITLSNFGNKTERDRIEYKYDWWRTEWNRSHGERYCRLQTSHLFIRNNFLIIIIVSGRMRINGVFVYVCVYGVRAPALVYFVKIIFVIYCYIFVDWIVNTDNDDKLLITKVSQHETFCDVSNDVV